MSLVIRNSSARGYKVVMYRHDCRPHNSNASVYTYDDDDDDDVFGKFHTYSPCGGTGHQCRNSSGSQVAIRVHSSLSCY